MSFKTLAWNLLVTAAMPFLILAAIVPSRRRDTLVWGSRPLISFAYWSRAMRAAGWRSRTMMQDVYAINSAADFDVLFIELAPAWLPRVLRMGIGTLAALWFVLRCGRVMHMPFDGFALHASWWWWAEAHLLRQAGVKIIVLPYGADFYAYSRVIDTSARHGLLATYPQLARREALVRKRMEQLNRLADAIVPGYMLDGTGRWDVCMPSIFSIDTKVWHAKTVYSDADGLNGPVRVLHTPNHRGFKGTEFLIAAIDTLRAEGLLVELVLLEKKPNSEVRQVMQEIDILAEQFIATAYALSGIEGMASGLPVLANLDHENYTRLFRRFSFLDECPIWSTSPERIAETLRVLVRNPGLRRELGSAGRAYAEKYHSTEAAQYLFGCMYRNFLDGENIDLINLFHPLKSAYNSATALVEHPLIESRLPALHPAWRC